jgi:hypothetical protein
MIGPQAIYLLLDEYHVERKEMNNMTSWMSGVAVLLALGAADEPKTDLSAVAKSAQSIPEQMQAITQEFQVRQAKLAQRLSRAHAGKSSAQLRRAWSRLNNKRTARYLALAEQNAKNPEVLPLMEYLLTNISPPPAKAIDILLQYHVQSKQIGGFCLTLTEDGENPPGVERLARAVMEKNSFDDAKCMASLALARVLQVRADASANPDKTQPLLKEADAILNAVLEKYPNVALPAHADQPAKSAAQLAKPHLFEIRHLQSGMQVPALKAEDLDGKPVALADYRGKVVLLYFWEFR